MNEFQELLERFNSLPKVESTPPTFMEIAGYPHYENVCSNILAFFFDTVEKHDYGTLFIESLLKSLKEDIEEDLTSLNVYREFVTDIGNRLDIVIETENFVVGIENKIWAPLYNNLEDYSNCLAKKYPEKEIIKVVLSLDEIEDKYLSNDFRSVTHAQFLNFVQSGLGSHIVEGPNKYLFQLTDFIQTMQNHTNFTNMNEKSLNFFIEEKENVENFLNEYREIQRRIHNKVKTVQNIINQKLIDESIILQKNRQWIWQKFDLVHDFDFGDGLIISVDSYFEIDGIGIKVWVRKGTGNHLQILNGLNLKSKDPQIVDNQFWIQKKSQMPILTSDQEVAEVILNVLKEIKIDTAEHISLN